MFDILDHLITHEQKGLLQRQHMPGILLRLFQRALLNRLLMNLIKGQDPTDGGGGGMMKDISSLCRAPEISNLHGVMQRYGYSVFTSGTTYNYKCFCGYPSTDGLPTASCKHCGFHIHLICTLGSQFTLDNCCIEHASKMPELYTYSETHARRWQQLLREQYQIVGHDDHFKDAPHDHENTDPIKPVIQGNLSKHMLPDPELVVEDDSDDNNFTMDELMIASVADLLRETQEQSHPLSYPVKAPDYNLKDGPHDDENTDSAKPEIQGNLSRHMLSDPELVAEDDSDNNNLTMDELSLIRPDTNMNREMLHEGIKDVIKRLLKIKEFLKLILHFPDSTALAQYREGKCDSEIYVTGY